MGLQAYFQELAKIRPHVESSTFSYSINFLQHTLNRILNQIVKALSISKFRCTELRGCFGGNALKFAMSMNGNIAIESHHVNSNKDSNANSLCYSIHANI